MILYKMIALKFGQYLDNDQSENKNTPTIVETLMGRLADRNLLYGTHQGQ